MTTLQRMILRANGATEPLEEPAGLDAFNRATDEALPFTVRLPDGWVMMGDDNGIAKGLPVNEAATALYHSVCRPGTTHKVHGDVLVTVEADFGGDDDF